MTQSRDFGPMAGDMRAALERYSKEELIDLMTHLVRVYVLEENAPLTPDAQAATAPPELSQLTFPQVVLHLQMVLQLEALDRFRVSGEQIFVTVGEEEFLLDGPTPHLPPEARNIPAAPSLAEAEARQAAEVRPAPAIDDAPRAPVTGEADFEVDKIADRHAAELRKAREEAGLPPDRPVKKPAPQRVSGGRKRPSRMDSLFGGGGGSTGVGGGLSMRPPKGPPPIAKSAPGDPTDDEKRTQARATRHGSDGEGGHRAGFEEPPPLAEGDREIKSSNRFADLELD